MCYKAADQGNSVVPLAIIKEDTNRESIKEILETSRV